MLGHVEEMQEAFLDYKKGTGRFRNTHFKNISYRSSLNKESLHELLILNKRMESIFILWDYFMGKKMFGSDIMYKMAVSIRCSWLYKCDGDSF